MYGERSRERERYKGNNCIVIFFQLYVFIKFSKQKDEIEEQLNEDAQKSEGKRPRDGGWEGEKENETGQNKRQMSLMYQW